MKKTCLNILRKPLVDSLLLNIYKKFSKPLYSASLLLIIIVATFAGCREEPPTEVDSFAWLEDSGDFPYVNPLMVSGDLVAAGSSTVAPLAAFLVERYKEDGYGGQISVDVIGSGAGFERFTVVGESDIAMASRLIKESEVQNAAKIGRNPISFRVGSDALSVVVSEENVFLNNLSAEELALVFGSARRWIDINPAWPNEEILRYMPGTDSGTFDFFVELIFHNDPEEILSAGNTQFSEDDNVLVRGVASSPYAIGFFGYAYYLENQDILRALLVEGIEPNLETVLRAEGDSIAKNAALGGYPLSRPLFLYSDAEIMRNKPQVSAFIAYFINNVNDVIEEVGYFPSDLEPAKRDWLNAMAGSY